jgi:chromosome segregation ATPase
MAEDTTTSSGSAGVMPATGSPVTGTTTADGVTPQKSSRTLEEALARIAELEHTVRNKTEENDRHSKNLSARDKELAAYKEKERQAQEAALSEVERATKRAQDAEQQLQQYKQQLISAHVQLAAQKKGIIDPEIAALAVQTTLEYGEDGMPSNLDDALDKLIKSKPYLVAPKQEKPAEQPAPESPAQTAQRPALQTPAIPAMNPGRSTIAAPNSLPPGRIPTLADVFSKRQ